MLIIILKGEKNNLNSTVSLLQLLTAFLAFPGIFRCLLYFCLILWIAGRMCTTLHHVQMLPVQTLMAEMSSI